MKSHRLFLVICLLSALLLLTACGGTKPPHDATQAPVTPTEPHDFSSATGIYLNGTWALSYIQTNDCSAQWFNDPEMGTVLKVQASGKRNYITLDYESMMASLGLTPVSARDYRYAAVLFKTAAGYGGSFDSNEMTLGYAAGDRGECKISDCAVTDFSKKEIAWQWAVLDLSQKPSDGRLHSILLSAAYGARSSDYYCVYSVLLLKNITEVIIATDQSGSMAGLTTALNESIVEGVSFEKQTAPHEDATVDLWFDHVSERKPQNDTVSSGMNSYLLRMPSNSIEGCQFFLAPKNDRTFALSLTPFSDNKGNTLRTELFYEDYFLVDGHMMPDALPPLKGPIAVKGNTSQGFYIKAWADTAAPAGLYTASLQVKDDVTGKEIKVATVYAYVWDFSLSDKTAMKTAISMWPHNVVNSYADHGMTDLDSTALYKLYYDFFLDNRMCCKSIPYPLTDERAWEYVNNPRVNTFLIGDVPTETYLRLKENPEVFQKGYFYPLDEPYSMEMLLQLQEYGRAYEALYPEYRMVAPFFTNITVNNSTDQIAFMSDYLSIWNTKINAFTPAAYKKLPGAEYLMTDGQVEQFGSFQDRMAKEVAEGDELWAYFCWEPREPYVNWLITGDGTEPIVSVWQCRNTDCTGILYWCATNWTEDMKTTPDGTTPVWGDGVLIYSGADYGLYEPISSLRLENVRDGIEDYQMLSMVEELAGAAEADRITSLVSVNVLAYTTDGDHLHAARILLGERVEELMK